MAKLSERKSMLSKGTEKIDIALIDESIIEIDRRIKYAKDDLRDLFGWTSASGSELSQGFA